MAQDHFPNALTKNDPYFCILKVRDIHVLMNLGFFFSLWDSLFPDTSLFFLVWKVKGKPKSNSKEFSLLSNSEIKSCLV